MSVTLKGKSNMSKKAAIKAAHAEGAKISRHYIVNPDAGGGTIHVAVGSKIIAVWTRQENGLYDRTE